MPGQALTSDDNRFIDDIASLLTPWGMPQAAARLYGYLLLSPDAVTLDQIAQDLAISKSSASVAARLLDRYLLARRFGERGSKRVFYTVSDNYSGVLLAQSGLLGSVAAVLQRRAPTVDSEVTRRRLHDAAAFYQSVRGAIEETVRKSAGLPDK